MFSISVLTPTTFLAEVTASNCKAHCTTQKQPFADVLQTDILKNFTNLTWLLGRAIKNTKMTEDDNFQLLKTDFCFITIKGFFIILPSYLKEIFSKGCNAKQEVQLQSIPSI